MTKLSTLRNQVTTRTCRGSVLSSRHGACRPNNSSESVRRKSLLLNIRVAFRLFPALRVGATMPSQTSCNRRIVALVLCAFFAHLQRSVPNLTSALGCVATLTALSTGFIFAQDSTPAAPLLTINDAIQLAIANNRSLKIANLDVDKSRWQVAEVKTKRLPAFSSTILGSQLLRPVSFSFPAGAFGVFPSVGPIPSSDTKITTPTQPVAYVVSQATQPLSQLYKIHLGIRAQELNSQLTSEKARAARQGLIKDVKQGYYAVLQSESELDAAEANVQQYQELDRVVLQRVSQEAALKSDSLDVKAKYANEKYKVVQLRNTLDSRKEYLNNLLGRDIRTEFRTEHVPDASYEEVELKIAQGRALAQRPEIREAEINLRQAEYDRRIAKADYIPDVGMAFNYASNFNVDVLPRNMTSIGFELKWEPWEWGRRKDVVNQKKITETQAQTQLHEAQSKVLMDVNSRFRKLEESRMLIAVAQAQRGAAQQRLVEVTRKYQQQEVLLSDLLRQQATTSGARDDYQQALLGFWTAKSEFEKSLGEDQ
jgi:outer membrane protein